MSIQGEIDRLSAAKASIAASLQSMGVDPPDGTTLEQYAAQLAAIAVSAPWLPLSGGTMTGDITLKDKGFIENAKGTLGFDGVMIGQNNPASGASGYGRLEVQCGRIIFVPYSEEASKYVSLSPNGFNLNGIDILNCPTVDALKPKTATVTLTTDGWRKGEQTVTVNGILADSSAQIVDVCPANKPSADRWAAAGVWCTSQAANSLIFSCDSVPTEDINVNIRMQGVSA